MDNCELNHKNKREVVDYLCQEFQLGDGGSLFLQIPICQECLDKLYNDDLILLYCVNCSESHWIDKKTSKKPFLYNKGESIKWLTSCPMCHDYTIRLATAT